MCAEHGLIPAGVCMRCGLHTMARQKGRMSSRLGGVTSHHTTTTTHHATRPKLRRRARHNNPSPTYTSPSLNHHHPNHNGTKSAQPAHARRRTQRTGRAALPRGRTAAPVRYHYRGPRAAQDELDQARQRLGESRGLGVQLGLDACQLCPFALYRRLAFAHTRRSQTTSRCSRTSCTR